jgi:NAD(P)H dehydrogenase (quinone)
MTRIAITGASGRFGRQVAQRLLERIDPSDLILITRRPAALGDLADRGVDVRAGDFDRPDSLPPAFAGADRALIISTLSVGRRHEQHGATIVAAAAAGVRHVVYTSSGGIHPDNPAIVIPDHLRTEETLKGSGLAWTILRDSLYAESVVLKIAPRALGIGRWLSATGEGRLAPVSQADCVEVAASVLTADGHEHRTYELTGPELVSMRDVAHLASELTGRDLEYVPIDDATLDGLLADAGVPFEYSEGMSTPSQGAVSRRDITSYERGIREGYFAVLSEDVADVLGRPPRSLRSVFLDHMDALVVA